MLMAFVAIGLMMHFVVRRVALGMIPSERLTKRHDFDKLVQCYKASSRKRKIEQSLPIMSI